VVGRVVEMSDGEDIVLHALGVDEPVAESELLVGGALDAQRSEIGGGGDGHGVVIENV